MAVSGSGDVYVADTDNNRVDEFSQAGVFVRAFGKDVGGSRVDVCTSLCVAGTGGDGAGELETPRGVAVSGSGDVYVGDSDNNRVDEFTQAGVFVQGVRQGRRRQRRGRVHELVRGRQRGWRRGPARRPARGGGERVGRRVCR